MSYQNVEFYITGFGSFPGVPKNPTQVLVETLRSFLEKEEYAGHNLNIKDTRVVEVSAVGALQSLLDIQTGRLISKASYGEDSDNTITIFLHFGVGCTKPHYRLEQKAYNCM